jgi:hypothetical protein
MHALQGEQAGDDGGALKDHFQLTCHLSRKIAALLLDEAANGGDEHFTADNDDGHPRGDAAGRPFGCEVDERAANNDLIDERIEDAAELGHLAVLAGPPTVDPIRRGGDDEDDHRGQIMLKRDEDEDDDRQHEAERREDVGNVDDRVGRG